VPLPAEFEEEKLGTLFNEGQLVVEWGSLNLKSEENNEVVGWCGGGTVATPYCFCELTVAATEERTLVLLCW